MYFSLGNNVFLCRKYKSNDKNMHDVTAVWKLEQPRHSTNESVELQNKDGVSNVNNPTSNHSCWTHFVKPNVVIYIYIYVYMTHCQVQVLIPKIPIAYF